MKVRTVLAILSLPLLLSLGCARGEQVEEEGAGMEEGMAAGEMAMGAASTVNLSPLNNSGISGTAEISHSEDDATVVLQMSGLVAGSRYPAHIHSGSCEQQGPVAASLSAVEATADGTGSSTTTVALSELGEMNEGEMEEVEHPETRLYVQLHQPDGTPASCANIVPGQGSGEM